MNQTGYKLFLCVLAFCLVLSGCTGQPTEQGPLPSVEDEIAALSDLVDLDSADFITAEDGDEAGNIYIPAEGYTEPSKATVTPDTVWSAELADYIADFTMPEDVAMLDGSLGLLTIPAISLSVSVYETDDEIEDMAHGVAHMKETSAWTGNVGLAGHNRGVNTYFGKLHLLNVGDTMTYETAQGVRTYQVVSTQRIDEMDWSLLTRTGDNRLTLITCVDDTPSQRLCVQAVEVP